jgi:hypothetical protein
MSSDGMMTPKCAQESEKDNTNTIVVKIAINSLFFIVVASL